MPVSLLLVCSPSYKNLHPAVRHSCFPAHVLQINTYSYSIITSTCLDAISTIFRGLYPSVSLKLDHRLVYKCLQENVGCRQ